MRELANGDKTMLMTKQSTTTVEFSESIDQPVNGKTNEVISLVTHELKNPLSSMKGYSELLLAGAVGDLNPDQQRFMRTILANIERMAELVADLSDASHLDSGRIRMELEEVDAATEIKKVISLLITLMDEKGLLLCTDIPDDLPHIHADRIRFGQVLMNLLGNAAKYTLPGGKITISAKCSGGDVLFAVQDDGIGITTEDQQLIFQRYHRSDDVKSREIPGTGLGLYITKQLVEKMGGRVWFKSDYGKGSTFYFALNEYK